MLVDPNNSHPTFCKLLLKEDFMNKILMPAAFIKEHKKMLGRTCLLKTNVTEKLWDVKIVREKSDYFICEGEWTQFVVHHKLELWDSLYFFLTAKSKFQVMIYSQKRYTTISKRQLQAMDEELSSSSESESESEEDIGCSRKSKRVKVGIIDLSDTEKDKPLLPSGVAVEKAEVRGEENGPKKNRFNVVNLNNKVRYFENVVRDSHSKYMTIPIEFARETGIIAMKKMTLVNREGKEWQVNILSHDRWVHITKGWFALRTDNNISFGDTCLFKLIKGAGGDSNVLQVQKILN